MDIVSWDTSNQSKLVISLKMLRYAAALFGFTGFKPVGLVISFGSPANQTCLGQAHFPPLEAVIADRSFQEFEGLAGRNFPNELLVDPWSGPDIIVREGRIRTDERVLPLQQACRSRLGAI